MRIRRKTLVRTQFAAEVEQVLFGQAAFEERAAVHAGAGVTLEVDLVTGETVFAAAAEEVVLGDFVQGRRTGKGADVPADGAVFAIRADDHGHRVPANDALDAAFDLAVAREDWLFVDGNRVDVGRRRIKGDINAGAMGFVAELFQQPLDTVGAGLFQDVLQRLQPFLGFDRIGIDTHRFGQVAVLGRFGVNFSITLGGKFFLGGLRQATGELLGRGFAFSILTIGEVAIGISRQGFVFEFATCHKSVPSVGKRRSEKSVSRAPIQIGRAGRIVNRSKTSVSLSAVRACPVGETAIIDKLGGSVKGENTGVPGPRPSKSSKNFETWTGCKVTPQAVVRF